MIARARAYTGNTYICIGQMLAYVINRSFEIPISISTQTTQMKVPKWVVCSANERKIKLDTAAPKIKETQIHAWKINLRFRFAIVQRRYVEWLACKWHFSFVLFAIPFIHKKMKSMRSHVTIVHHTDWHNPLVFVCFLSRRAAAHDAHEINRLYSHEDWLRWCLVVSHCKQYACGWWIFEQWIQSTSIVWLKKMFFSIKKNNPKIWSISLNQLYKRVRVVRCVFVPRNS